MSRCNTDDRDRGDPGAEAIDGLGTTHCIDGVFALVEALDLVICPSSTVGRIAASLGKPVWLLTVRLSPIHAPTAFRLQAPLFRKTQVQPWRPLMATVGDALTRYLGQLRARRISEGLLPHGSRYVYCLRITTPPPTKVQMSGNVRNTK
ncbi:MAG: hypothetical protein ACMVO3_00005 [Thalassobaculum sp.]